MNCDLIVYLVMYFTKYKIFLILYIFVFCLGFYSYMIIRTVNFLATDDVAKYVVSTTSYQKLENRLTKSLVN